MSGSVLEPSDDVRAVRPRFEYDSNVALDNQASVSECSDGIETRSLSFVSCYRRINAYSGRTHDGSRC